MHYNFKLFILSNVFFLSPLIKSLRSWCKIKYKYNFLYECCFFLSLNKTKTCVRNRRLSINGFKYLMSSITVTQDVLLQLDLMKFMVCTLSNYIDCPHIYFDVLECKTLK